MKNFKQYLLPLAALSTGFLLFSPWLVFVEIILGLAVWGSLGKFQVPSSTSEWTFVRAGKFQIPSVVFCGTALFLVSSRLFPFLSSSAPLGYDTGIYRYEFWNSFQALPEYVSGLFLGLPLVTDVGQLFGLSLDQILFGGAVLLSVLLVSSLSFFVSHRWGREVGFVAFCLAVISLVQFRAYEMILFKQMFAVAFVFFSFYLLRLRSFLVFIPLLFIALLQPLDAFLLGLSIAIYAIYSAVRKTEGRQYFVSLLGLGVLGVLGLMIVDQGFWSDAWTLFWMGLTHADELEMSLQEGIFLSVGDYGYQSAFFFVFGVLGWLMMLKRKQVGVFGIYAMVLFLWIAFRMFFYQRLLIQFDVVLLCYASLTLVVFYRQFAEDLWTKMICLLIAVGMIFPFGYEVMQFQPAIAEEELEGISDFCASLELGAYVAATDSYYGPWLRGYCLGHKVIAPGLFEHSPWTLGDWQSFWAGDRARILELMQIYEEPVYFYVGEKQPQLEMAADMFEEVDEGWYRTISHF